MNKINSIKKLSHYLRLVFSGAFILAPLLYVMAWLQLAYPMTFSSKWFRFTIMPDVPITEPMPLANMFLAMGISLIPLAFSLLICWFLIKLFRSYEAGHYFSFDAIKCLNRVAQLLFIKVLIEPFYQAAITATVTWHQVGKRMMSISFGNDDIKTLVIAAVVLLISWILSEACHLKEEQQYTV